MAIIANINILRNDSTLNDVCLPMRFFLLGLTMTVNALAIGGHCFALGSACEEFAKSDIVFIGRITAADSKTIGATPSRLTVEEVLKGLPPETQKVDVVIGARNGYNQHSTVGEYLLVFALRAEGRNIYRTTSNCTHSFRVKDHENWVRAIRSMATGGPSRLVGGVYGADMTRVANVLMELKSEAGHYTAWTDSRGLYEFVGVPPDKYSLRPSK